jgi:hypothetical protein
MTTGPVAQWIRHRPTEPGIAGSSPAGVTLSADARCEDPTKRRRRGRPRRIKLTQSKSPLWGSNPRPYAYEAHALPTELRRPTTKNTSAVRAAKASVPYNIRTPSKRPEHELARAATNKILPEEKDVQDVKTSAARAKMREHWGRGQSASPRAVPMVQRGPHEAAKKMCRHGTASIQTSRSAAV